MARELNRLSSRTVGSKSKSGYYADGGGLYLQVSRAGSKSWIFCYTRLGRSREMGLGSLKDFSLAEARDKAIECRKLLANNIDPIDARDGEHKQQELAAARRMTFSECAKAYIKAHSPKWKNEKHATQWTNTLDTYCGPIFGTLPVQDVDTALVAKVLDPIWTTKHETATRIRSRIENVLAWATVRGYRTGDNPARWRGHLKNLLPTISKLKRVQHHPALSFRDVGQFMKDLRALENTAARALEFTVLTACRTNEVIAAEPHEFNLKDAVWTIPAKRMKAGREHRVPLPPQAVEIIREQLKEGADYVFSGLDPETHLSNMAMLTLLKRMGRGDITVHGFRSTFRDWTAESTNYPREVCEMALAHTLGDKVEAAYRRGDLFEKRRRPMLEWAKYCDTQNKPAKIIEIRRKAKA